LSVAAVAIARSWIGTPYLHQASVQGAGCDCLGLLRGVWRAMGYSDLPMPPYTPDWDEVMREDVMLQSARDLLVERASGLYEVGDVLLFRMREGAVAKHLGILSGPTSFIHAYSGHGVIESRLTPPWARRIVGVFSFPHS